MRVSLNQEGRQHTWTTLRPTTNVKNPRFYTNLSCPSFLFPTFNSSSQLHCRDCFVHHKRIHTFKKSTNKVLSLEELPLNCILAAAEKKNNNLYSNNVG